MVRVNRSWMGVDLGATRIDAVVVTDGADGRAAVATVGAFAATDVDAVVELATGVTAIAIDAPAELSTAPHRGDETVNRKFRVARCGEIALGQQARIWVPWVTPADPAQVPGWMAVGFTLWRALRAAGHEPIEVYPAGIFRTLAGGPLPRKTTLPGHAARRSLLAPEAELPSTVEVWTHDGIDALAAAVTARRYSSGRARRFAHAEPGCDESAVWLPAVAETV
jgi:predicted nuclease with RNAse H fold